jgi:hypothetical protein
MRREPSLRRLLAGGDRRSIARSRRAHALVERSPARIGELAELARDGDRLIAMRAVDLLEKLAHDHPEWVQPHRRLFIGPLADSDLGALSALATPGSPRHRRRCWAWCREPPDEGPMASNGRARQDDAACPWLRHERCERP